MKRLFIIIALAGMTATACSTTQSSTKSTAKTASTSAADAQNQQLVQQMLDKKMYKVDFDRAYPTSGPSFALTSPYFVSVTGDRVESYLPYFGRAYSIPYGGGEGLRFEAPITDYTAQTGKKGQQVISFNARTSEDDYTFNYEIYNTGEAYLNINAVNKQGMSFSGNVDLEPDFKAVKSGE